MRCSGSCGRRASFLILSPPLPIVPSCLDCWLGWRRFTDAAWLPILTQKDSMAFTTFAPLLAGLFVPVNSDVPRLSMMTFSGFSRLDSRWPLPTLLFAPDHTPIYEFCLQRFWPLFWGSLDSYTWNVHEGNLMAKATGMPLAKSTVASILKKWEQINDARRACPEEDGVQV